MDINYYNGYLLYDMTVFDLTEYQKRLMDACAWMIDNHSTIRKTAANFEYSKSTLHRQIHQILPMVSCEMYQVIVRLLLEGKIC